MHKILHDRFIFTLDILLSNKLLEAIQFDTSRSVQLYIQLQSETKQDKRVSLIFGKFV